MRVIGILLLAGAALAQAPTYEVIANTGQLMQGLIQPAANALAEAAKDQGPADNRAWRTALNNAALLGESGQLLMMGSRVKDQDAWMKDCKALIDAAAAVSKAAQAKDLAAFQTATAGITATCQGCHSVYRQRGGRKADAAPKK